MLRIGNLHQRSMVEAEFRILFNRDEPLLEGGDFRYFYSLKLQFDRLPNFPAALTLRHVIDEHSPLYGATPESLEAGRVALNRVRCRHRSGHSGVSPNPTWITPGATFGSANVSWRSTLTIGDGQTYRRLWPPSRYRAGERIAVYPFGRIFLHSRRERNVDDLTFAFCWSRKLHRQLRQ